jgi:hypothetical protein
MDVKFCRSPAASRVANQLRIRSQLREEVFDVRQPHTCKDQPYLPPLIVKFRTPEVQRGGQLPQYGRQQLLIVKAPFGTDPSMPGF